MGIRFENKTKLNWVKEVEQFLRLLLEGNVDGKREKSTESLETAYRDFFNRERSFFQKHNPADLDAFIDELDSEQVPPLAELLLQDGLIHGDSSLLTNARYVLERNMRTTGAMSLQDYEKLSIISNALKT
ncbi:MAG: hypothetical protein ACTHZ1_12555 [Sphingobacterium sp.]